MMRTIMETAKKAYERAPEYYKLKHPYTAVVQVKQGRDVAGFKRVGADGADIPQVQSDEGGEERENFLSDVTEIFCEPASVTEEYCERYPGIEDPEDLDD